MISSSSRTPFATLSRRRELKGQTVTDVATSDSALVPSSSVQTCVFVVVIEKKGTACGIY